MISRIYRPTTMGLAFINAAAKDLNQHKKVDHQRWVARHVQDRAEHTKLGMKTEISGAVINSR